MLRKMMDSNHRRASLSCQLSAPFLSVNLPYMSILISLSLFSFHCSFVKASEPRGGLDVLKQSINFLSINLCGQASHDVLLNN